MYIFFYEYLKPKYCDKCNLLFTDTDSLCCHIETKDLGADMAENLHLFDTSNFKTSHPLYCLQNHRVLRKLKSETRSLAQSDFVGLRTKMYSPYQKIASNGNSSQKHKEVLHKETRPTPTVFGCSSHLSNHNQSVSCISIEKS